jgi:signal transduction histidine kinase
MKDRLIVLLGAAFVAVGAGFTASTVYTELHASAIDREVEKMETNSLPSVERLAAARAALRHLDVSAAQYADGVPAQQPNDRRMMDEARSALAREIHGEDETPDYPGEPEQRETSRQQLEVLEHSLARLVAPGATDLRSIYADVHNDIDAVDEALERWMDVNAIQGHHEVRTISEARRESVRLAVGLDAACVLLSLGAAVVALRAVRRQRDLEEAHERMLEERAHELDMFAKRVAHDLLNPLSALSFTLSSVRRAAERGEPVGPHVARADACLKRARRMVDGALDFARSGVQPTRHASADLREAVNGAVDEARSHEEVAAEVVVEPFTDVAVACDAGMLSSVLSNLVQNALKYMEGRDERRVTIRSLPADEGRRARVEVEDTGPGLPEGFEKRVWDAYVRAPDSGRPGLGLGLATVRRFVDSHGGRVGVESRPGKGCTFWFELPVASVSPT